MAANWMRSKLAKMARDRKAANHRVVEFQTVAGSNARSAQVAKLIASQENVARTLYATEPERAPERIGKQRRTLDRRCYGNGVRRFDGAKGRYYDLWDCAQRGDGGLIKRQG